MNDVITPDMIVAELRAVRSAAERGSDAIYHAELKHDAAEATWQDVYDLAYSLAEGTVALREIQARKAAKEAKLNLDIAKAELNRIKTKIRQLDAAQSNLQTQWKAIAITYQGAGQ